MKKLKFLFSLKRGLLASYTNKISITYNSDKCKLVTFKNKTIHPKKYDCANYVGDNSFNDNIKI